MIIHLGSWAGNLNYFQILTLFVQKSKQMGPARLVHHHTSANKLWPKWARKISDSSDLSHGQNWKRIRFPGLWSHAHTLLAGTATILFFFYSVWIQPPRRPLLLHIDRRAIFVVISNNFNQFLMSPLSFKSCIMKQFHY